MGPRLVTQHFCDATLLHIVHVQKRPMTPFWGIVLKKLRVSPLQKYYHWQDIYLISNNPRLIHVFSIVNTFRDMLSCLAPKCPNFGSQKVARHGTGHPTYILAHIIFSRPVYLYHILVI